MSFHGTGNDWKFYPIHCRRKWHERHINVLPYIRARSGTGDPGPSGGGNCRSLARQGTEYNVNFHIHHMPTKNDSQLVETCTNGKTSTLITCERRDPDNSISTPQEVYETMVHRPRPICKNLRLLYRNYPSRTSHICWCRYYISEYIDMRNPGCLCSWYVIFMLVA